MQTGEINSHGIELEGTATLTEGFNIRGAYSYIDAVVTKDPVNVGKAPTTVPLNRFALWNDYTLQGGPLRGVRYVGSTFGNDANSFKVNASTAIDALITYNKDNWRMALNVTNLADTRYVAACYGYSSRFYAEAARRSPS